jgi:hypothetical protein
MAEDERMEILKKLERGEISATQAEELLEALEAGVDVEEAPGGGKAEVYTDITEWSPEGAIAELRVNNFVGDIAVRAGEHAFVVATIKARAKDAAAAKKLFEKVEMTFDERDGKAAVKADITKSLLDIFRGARVSVDFDVTLPADAAFVASYGTGKLTTEGVATVRASGGNGKVETDAGRVDVNLGNGKLSSRGARDLTVNGGNLRLYLEEADGLEKFHFNAGNGKVELNAARLAENADYAVNLGNGKLVAAWGRKPTDCVIKIESLAGSLETDIPFDKKGTTMVYADGEPKASVKINAAHSKVVITVKEDK